MLYLDQKDSSKKEYLEDKMKEYRERARKLKEQILKWSIRGEIKDKIHIVENSKGHSYKSVFGKYLNDAVKEILLEEPYLREYFQVRIV